MTGTRDIPPSDGNLVWYAGYGSNLSRARFDCYINGGTPAGSTQRCPGCRDKTPPRADRDLRLPHQLYFADHSETWGGAVAFIRPTPSNATTYARMYLITYGQFNDVVRQENGKKVPGSIIVPPFDELARGREWPIPKVRLYGRLLKVGTEGEHPILTFSATRDEFTLGAPSEAYLKIIVFGLQETYPSLCESQILEYFGQAEGIRGTVDPDALACWVLGH
jgi:hypothetical protein